MDRARPGRRRASSEIVTEGKRKKSSPADLQKITKLLTVKSEDVLAQSPLPKLRGSECWWTRSLRNKVICLDHKTTKAAHGCPPKALPKRHLKVMLTNVLWTDLGREFRKTLPRNDAKLCDTSKVQSDSLPSTSVDSIETCQRLDPLHQSLNLSERIPRVILTDIRQTELGRKYLKIPSVTEASLSDTASPKSEELSSSADGSLESCQNVNHLKSFLSERLISTKGRETVPLPQASGD
ncbi:SUMO1/sentrin specific protease 7 (predicted), isoform CRA_b [Rattus norvegicus]|uniref:SUMO1/sentrin specific protease 7 (Predicted), isoform CRA_b n=1 Tax=Rattus norvegicus TaxID=10116 RepID=A6IQP9_RAT|nr:SUMO1/sentrin specific protease 7 (predicted), isoform CRA_b [Rattus norvegicus]